MSTSPEAAGASVPAPAASPAAPPAAPALPTCGNCEAPVPGKFCGNCGQRLHSPVHSMWHFLGEATEDLTHADSRLWHTLLALLLKPGFLTREFLDGRRASYLPPVRLYLVLSVVFFLVAASGNGRATLVGLDTDDDGPSKVVVSSLNSIPGESTEQLQARLGHACNLIHYQGWWSSRLQPAMRKACLQYAAGNGRSVRETFYHELPRAMFVFLPLLAAVMKLLYRRPRHYYIEHLLLLVHNHAFVFLIVSLSWLIQRALPASAAWPMALLQFAGQTYVALYVYWSMRRVYGQGRLLTVSKYVVMSGAYILSAGIMIVLTGVYSTLLL